MEYLGSTANPNEAWMIEAVEQVTNDGGLLGGDNHPRLLLMDRDTKFSLAFRTKLKAKGVKPLVLPARSPNMNAYIERFMGTFKRELIHRMIFFGKGSLDNATKTFLEHYHQDRPHQGLKSELILPFPDPPNLDQEIVVDRRLGGLLKSYRRAAA